MKIVSIREAQEHLEELAHDVEQGETVVITREGKPALNLVLKEKRGVDWEAGEAYLRSKGIVRTKGFIADDFDDPLPEDFLLRPLP